MFLITNNNIHKNNFNFNIMEHIQKILQDKNTRFILFIILFFSVVILAFRSEKEREKQYNLYKYRY